MMLGNLPLGLREFAHNIKDHDYVSCGQYKIDENESTKVLDGLQIVNNDLYKINDRNKGSWLDIKESTGWFRCSICASTVAYKSNYCPNCGSIMETDINK